jgi:cellulose synthase/poly-beta-1,6-N-acetylglucosamine synthase-like glycosyltransferase
MEVRLMGAANPILASSNDQAAGCPTVSIVIPVYNGASTIRLCLDAILSQDFPREQFEVIVVDNNSTDGTPEIVKQYPVLLLYERELQGPHAATNTGVRQAQGDIVAFTDSDCIPQRGWLSTLVAPFADENVVGVGGKIEAYQPRTRIEWFLQEEVHLFRNCVRLSESFPASVITGNAAYRTSALRQVGLFNANLYTGAEVDLAWRVQWATGKEVVYVPESIVYHIFRPTLRRMFRHFRIYGYSEILLGTLHKDRSDYPMKPRRQIRVILSQCQAMLTYTWSLPYRALTCRFRHQGVAYVLSPALWMVAEGGNICGKLQGLWDTRFYRKQFWMNGPKPL